MPIEFRCPTCAKLLKTPDGSSGKQATCPECNSRVTVPAVPATPRPPQEVRSGSPFTNPEIAPANPTDAENPFRSPSGMTGEAPNASALSLTPRRIQFERAFGATWKIYAANWAESTLMMLCFIGLAVLIVGFLAGVVFAIAAITESEEATIFVSILAGIPAWIFLVWLQIGFTIYFLKMARGEEFVIGDLFSGGKYFARFLGVSVLVGLIVFGGFLLFIVPGIIFWLMFMHATYVVLDRNGGIMESLNVSKEIAYGNKMMIFAILLVTNVVSSALNQVTCNLAMFVTVPFWMILCAVIYLQITGQPLAPEAEQH